MDDETSPDAWTPELRAFVYSCIDSVDQVQVLVLLGSSEESWTARRVAQETLLGDHAVRDHLESMAARGLVSVSVAGDVSTWRYAPKTATLRRLADDLIAQYRRAPMAVVRLVASNARPSIRRIAEAFRFRERK